MEQTDETGKKGCIAERFVVLITENENIQILKIQCLLSQVYEPHGRRE